jgi:hypothetical protein
MSLSSYMIFLFSVGYFTFKLLAGFSHYLISGHDFKHITDYYYRLSGFVFITASLKTIKCRENKMEK